MNRSATFHMDLTRFIDAKRGDASGTHRLRTMVERNQDLLLQRDAEALHAAVRVPAWRGQHARSHRS